MNISKLVSTFVGAAALAVALSPSTASATTIECKPAIPTGGLTSSCGTLASGRRSTQTVTITQQGRRYVYTTNLVAGTVSSGALLNQDGTTPTRDNSFPTPGKPCPVIVDQTPNSGTPPSASCNVAFAFAGKFYRTFVSD